MKVRDYLFWTTLTCVSLFVGHWLRGPQQPLDFSNSSLPHATFWEKTTYWLALARLAHGAPRQMAPDRQELPAEVVNAPAVRLVGPDGEPLLDHGAGW